MEHCILVATWTHQRLSAQLLATTWQQTELQMEGDLAKLREWSKRFEVFASQQALGGATNPMEMKVYLLSRRKMSKMNINAVSAKYMYISIYMFYHMSYICIYVYIYIYVYFFDIGHICFFLKLDVFPFVFSPGGATRLQVSERSISPWKI